LQSFGIDPKKVRELEISLQVRTNDVRPGQDAGQLPMLRVTFFDSNRAEVKASGNELGPWSGTRDWEEKHATIAVPRNARLANLYIGMAGGTGEISFDDVQIRAVGAKAK
jgi:hypothetical protein